MRLYLKKGTKLVDLKQFKSELNQMNKKYILYMLMLPIILIILMLIPSKASLIFNIYNPSWWQYFTLSFVHNDWSHLISNLGLYLIVVFLSLYLASLAKIQKEYFRLIVIIVLSFPIISSLIIKFLYPILIPNLKYDCGISGIVSALIGLIPSLWIASVLKQDKHKFLNNKFLLICSFYILFLFLVRYYPLHHSLLSLVVVFLFLLICLWIYRHQAKQILIESCNILKEKQLITSCFIIMLLLIFVVISTSLFPADILNGNVFKDFFVHLLGITYGLCLGYFYFKTKVNK